ncbi:MAG: hypothetical protein OEQ18_13250, partial [Gammaproteobacteria bacterium]|nr:hypothetical protein [Gammaproteobacteria bacterium]
MIVLVWAVWLLVCLGAGQAHATTYYVATSGAGGSDSNTCTQAQTDTTGKLTWAGGKSCLSSGDTLEFKAGTYAGPGQLPGIPSGGGTWGTATTISNYQNDEVIFTPPVAGQDVLRFNTGNNYIILDGLIFDGAGGWHGIQSGTDTHHIRIANGTIRNAPKQGFLLTLRGNTFEIV